MPTGNFLVISSDTRTSQKNSKPYIDLILAKEGGDQISGKIWSEFISGPIEANKVYTCWYKDSEYQGQKQVVVESYTLREISLQIFKTPPVVDQGKVYEKLFKRAWTQDCFNHLFISVRGWLEGDEETFKRLFEVPAGAKNHHSSRAGLLQHMEEMWDTAQALMVLPYFSKLVNLEILLASIVFHDLGKIYEYSPETLQWDENRELAYIGHTVFGAMVIERHWPNTEDELKKKLIHSVLSHHGKLEHAAPVVPKTPEAVALHLIDAMSAKFNAFQRVADLPGRPEFSRAVDCVPVTEKWPVK